MTNTTHAVAPDDRPDLAFVIPACNEQAWIGRTIQSIREAAEDCLRVDVNSGPLRVEIIVVDNDSRDETSEVAEEYGAHVVHHPLRNIGGARNRGVRETAAARLIFVDADTSVNSSLLAETIRAWENGATWGSAIVAPSDRCPWWATFLGVFFNFYYTRVRRCAYGCYFFVSREAFESVGGFPEHLIEGEDMGLSFALTKRFGKLHLLGERIHSSARKAREFGFWFHLRLLWLMMIYRSATPHPDVILYRDADRRLD